MKTTTFHIALIVFTTNCAAAFGATVCNNASEAALGVPVAVSGYVRIAFVPQCSANTFVEVQDNTTHFAVGAASSRGRASFAGASLGGGVRRIGDCAVPGACAVSDAQAALLAASS